MLRKLNNDILIGLLVASLFWVGVFVWQSTQPPHHKGAESQTCEGTKSECAKAATDERIADYTWWLAVLNAALVTVAAGQGYFLLRADKNARIAANAAEQAANAAIRQARVAESALFAVEIPYLYVVVKSYEITVKGHAIRTIGTMNVDGIGIDEMDFSDVITFCFENVGRTPAEIIEFSADLLFEGWPPAPVIPPEKLDSKWASEIVAARSQSKERGCSFGNEKLLLGGGMDREREGLWFKGYVRYSDVFKNEYIYGFCLGLSTLIGPDDTRSEFYTSGGDGYNYRKQVKTGGQLTKPPNTS